MDLTFCAIYAHDFGDKFTLKLLKDQTNFSAFRIFLDKTPCKYGKGIYLIYLLFIYFFWCFMPY